MKELIVKGLTIGSGIPKTIVSLMGATADELAAQVREGLESGVQCFEYRADFAADPLDFQAVNEAVRGVAAEMGNHPLMFTFRSEGQGGRATLSRENYVALCEAAIEAGAIDMIDVESWIGEEHVRRLCGLAHDAGVLAVVSFHDFTGTPAFEDMAAMLARFSELGADIPKIAVMAHSAHDALDLLCATERVRASGSTGPLLTMAMGPAGSITRLTGEAFGSALTFCSLGTPSAPGQVGVAQALDIMGQLHEIADR